LRGYKPKNIYKVDESGLFFRLLPNKIMSFKRDPLNDGKNSKERIMVLLGCNAKGTQSTPTISYLEE
jgi:hypothetical protein